jgi:hypothetical protein
MFYSPKIVREAVVRKVFGDRWPAHTATQQEVEDRASRDDALRHIPNAVRKLSRLAILIYESARMHVDEDSTHPHTIAQVNAWLDAQAPWVRLKPDGHYVERIMAKKPSREIQNPAGRRVDRETIRNLVEPKAVNGGPTDGQSAAATACELADRTYRIQWSPTLAELLVAMRREGKQ